MDKLSAVVTTQTVAKQRVEHCFNIHEESGEPILTARIPQ